MSSVLNDQDQKVFCKFNSYAEHHWKRIKTNSINCNLLSMLAAAIPYKGRIYYTSKNEASFKHYHK